MVFKCIDNLAPDYPANKFRLRFVFMAGKLDQLVPWIYLFTAFQLVRGLLLIEDETVDLIKQQSCVFKMFQEI